MKRAEVVFLGHVQGVGFRYATHRLAQQFQVTGFVRNEENGSVLVTVEGPAEQIQQLIEAVCQQMNDFIREHHVRWQEATGQWNAFSIAH